MKKIPKKLLDKMICTERKVWKNAGGDNADLHSLNIYIARDIEEKCGLEWLAICNLLHSILGYKCFRPNATNKEIYDVIRMLGWEVSDEEQESESL